MSKPKLAKGDLDQTILELVAKANHKALATWALDCAERVLPYFEKTHPKDDRPKLAIKAGRDWVTTGVFSMAVIRKASLDSHAAARECSESGAALSAARAAGQAVAAAHAKTHSVAAAIYAVAAVRDAVDSKDAGAVVTKEREWQRQRFEHKTL